MTLTIPQTVNFGYFFGICKSLWLICRSLENGELYQKFNQSINEFYYCIGGIELNDTLLNPLLFETHQFGYKIHITNCCKLTLNDG